MEEALFVFAFFIRFYGRLCAHKFEVYVDIVYFREHRSHILDPMGDF